MKVAEEEAQLLARKSREAEEEIRRARESAVKVTTSWQPYRVSNTIMYLFRVKRKNWQWRRGYFLQKIKLVLFHKHQKKG